MTMPFLQALLDSELADFLDRVSLQVNAAAEAMSQAYPQVRVLDFYTLSAVSVHQEADLYTCYMVRGTP